MSYCEWVRASLWFYPEFTLLMCSSSGFGSCPYNHMGRALKIHFLLRRKNFGCKSTLIPRHSHSFAMSRRDTRFSLEFFSFSQRKRFLVHVPTPYSGSLSLCLRNFFRPLGDCRDQTRWIVLQKARCHPDLRQDSNSWLVYGFSSISLPFRGSFHLSLTVLVRYRSRMIFSLGS